MPSEAKHLDRIKVVPFRENVAEQRGDKRVYVNNIKTITSASNKKVKLAIKSAVQRRD